MSNASQRAFGAAQRERNRRVGLSLEGELPIGSLAVTGEPGWDAFFGSLREKEDAARKAGMGFRASLGDIGRFDTPTDGGGRLTDTDRAGIVGNIALGNLTDANAVRQIAMQRMADQQRDELVDSLKQSDQERQIASALATPERASITTETTSPEGKTAYSITNAAPETERERILAQLPPPLRPQFQAQWAAQDLATRKQDEVERAAKQKEAESAAAVLSPEAIDENADLFLKTGKMPTLGMKDPGNRAKILNRAAEKTAGIGGGNVAANTADYKADSASLVKLQQQRDAVGAFEDTALKNLDVFLDLAKKIPDTGSPALNKPLRAIDEKALGSSDLAAYNAARRTVIPEFAKILSNPTLSGQLSDSARKEVEDVISGGATLAQTLAIANTLKTDAANRRTSYDDQLSKVRERISKGSGKPSTAPNAADLRKKYDY